ncbi:Serine/threonine-protein kinase PrkC [Novipirellula aureliae]|uniref:Serine/threonine-protein kinase PrkC n=1 Tax=Novipirellula aureliae TaxID=2527966 RepID=A0A5C6DTA3_9BACT|nr:serine/threonine-protein kinase [Novipirellula aureliae]TWU39912.1 Serine/threonine-protein kinase PrkC [Novipirellula aureliae]
MTAPKCPTQSKLIDYLLGNVSGDDWHRIAEHLDSCEHCEATISALDGESDTLIESLRRPDINDEIESEAYQRAVQGAVAAWSESAAKSMVPSVKLRDYELIEPIGCGGMATVYRAIHTRLNREVAIKVLPARLLHDGGRVARFQREMQAVGSLRHHAIVQATDGGEVDGVHFLVMEIVDGLDCNKLSRLTGQWSIENACRLAHQTALGMAHVHEFGMVHRDLKPSNLMVTRDGEVKILDLGLARIASEPTVEDELTTVGQLMGTLDYMAPEQLEDSHVADQRSDIYSLGATLFKLLTGVAPRAGAPRESVLTKIRRISSEPAVSIALRRGDLPGELVLLVDSMLSASPVDRPKSMNEVVERIEGLAQDSDLGSLVSEAEKIEQSVGQEREASVGPLPSERSTPKVLPVVSEANGKPPRRTLPWIIAAAGSMAAFVLGAVIILQTSSGQLVIETASPDVEVRLLKSGHPHQNMTLTDHAQTFRLGAGEYEIEIVSDADGLVVENGHYTLRRGETWLAKVGPKDKRSELGEHADTTKVDPNQPTYQDKTIDEWIDLLGRERSPEQLVHATKAFERLAEPARVGDAVAALVQVVSYQDDDDTYTSGGTDTNVVYAVQEYLAKQDQQTVADMLTRKLGDGSDREKQFILKYLNGYTARIKGKVRDSYLPLLASLWDDDSFTGREELLFALINYAPADTLLPRLVNALDNKEAFIRLMAADELIKRDVHADAVVATLSEILARDKQSAYRLKAAWSLGDLGPKAASAYPLLVSIVQSDDADLDVDVHSFFAGPKSMTTIKDASIGALAKIGNMDAFPILFDQWKTRLDSANDGRGTHSAESVAKAIEALSGMKPRVKVVSRVRTIYWTIEGVSLTLIYRATFNHTVSSPVSPTWAEKLLAVEEDVPVEDLIGYANHVDPRPDAAQAKLQVELILLLAKYQQASETLATLLRHAEGISRRSQTENTAAKSNRSDAAKVFEEAAETWIREQEDQPESLLEQLVQSCEAGSTTSCDVALKLLDRMDRKMQTRAIASALLFGVQYANDDQFVVETVVSWHKNKENRQQVNEFMRTTKSISWSHIARFLFQNGLADDDTRAIVLDRFKEYSNIRNLVLTDILQSLEVHPENVDFVIELLRHPALDVVKSDDGASVRASHYLPQLEFVPEDHRQAFVPWLEELRKSANKAESEAANAWLKLWRPELGFE